MTKNKYEQGVTTAGTAVYPRVNAPDFKYKKEKGEYSIKLKQSSADAAPLIAQITKVLEESYKTECAKQGKAKIKRAVAIPYKDEEDDQGAKTGNIIFSFKMPGCYKDKAGMMVKMAPRIIDRYGKEITEEVWGGSEVKVAYFIKPYFTDALGHGVSLGLRAVQVLNLVTKGSNAGNFGFDIEERPEADVEETIESTPQAVEGATHAATSGDF